MARMPLNFSQQNLVKEKIFRHFTFYIVLIKTVIIFIMNIFISFMLDKIKKPFANFFVSNFVEKINTFYKLSSYEKKWHHQNAHHEKWPFSLQKNKAITLLLTNTQKCADEMFKTLSHLSELWIWRFGGH